MMQLDHHDQRQAIEQKHVACSQSKLIMKSQCLIYIVKENTHPGSLKSTNYPGGKIE